MNNYKKDKMKYEYVLQIVNWKYDKEYSIYNMPSIEVMKEKIP